jgi:hypothetical protein
MTPPLAPPAARGHGGAIAALPTSTTAADESTPILTLILGAVRNPSRRHPLLSPSLPPERVAGKAVLLARRAAAGHLAKAVQIEVASRA